MPHCRPTTTRYDPVLSKRQLVDALVIIKAMSNIHMYRNLKQKSKIKQRSRHPGSDIGGHQLEHHYIQVIKWNIITCRSSSGTSLPAGHQVEHHYMQVIRWNIITCRSSGGTSLPAGHQVEHHCLQVIRWNIITCKS